MIISATIIDKKTEVAVEIIIDELAGAYSWMGSRYVGCYSSGSAFYVRNIKASGNLEYCNLCTANLNTSKSAYGHSDALAPVVSLKSGIKIEKWKGQGTEDNPWRLCE